MADATETGVNVMFWMKLALSGAALLATLVVRRRVLGHGGASTGTAGTPLAAAAMLLWLGALAAGRLTAYFAGAAGAR
jgi:hypothetical protein